MASNKKSVKNFIAMWDNQGLECIFDVDAEMAQRDAYEKRKLWNILKDEKMLEYRPSIPLQSMILRAKYNSQRHYEIYQFVTDGMSEKEVREIFAECPQTLVEWIRENGNKIYSDYVKSDRKLIV
jgi:hypothetical protein